MVAHGGLRAEGKLRAVMGELAYNLESFNPAFTAVLLQVCSTARVQRPRSIFDVMTSHKPLPECRAVNAMQNGLGVLTMRP